MTAERTCALADTAMNIDRENCQVCGEPLQKIGGLWICQMCNDSQGIDCKGIAESLSIFAEDSDKVLIECPGATLYLPGTNEISAGVRFIDDDDPSRGHEIIRHPVYGPHHVRRRWVKKEDVHLIRRCQSCQDHTVRMRRKEGPDLYIPSIKYPQRRPFRQR